VIEVTDRGEVAYANPVALAIFPDLPGRGQAHELLSGLGEIVQRCRDEDLDFISREIDLGERVFEQKICIVLGGLVHIYAHDITALRRAEEEVQVLAGQLRLLAQRVVLAQEQERKRIAQELHDEAGQALVALKMSLELLRKDPPESSEEISFNLLEATRMIDATRNQIRLLAQGLRPPALDTLGIRVAIEEFCDEFSVRTRLVIEYRSDAIPPVSEAVSICLYRCLQQALANVADHARATRVRVNLQMKGRDIELSVQDDGRGIAEADPDLERSGTGIGLLGMRERLELLDGDFAIDSVPGKGTNLVARIPLDGENGVRP
jgi:signal transduction histidine kinase